MVVSSVGQISTKGIQSHCQGRKDFFPGFIQGKVKSRAGCAPMAAASEFFCDAGHVDLVPCPEADFNASAWLFQEKNADFHSLDAASKVHQVFRVRGYGAGGAIVRVQYFGMCDSTIVGYLQSVQNQTH